MSFFNIINFTHYSFIFALYLIIAVNFLGQLFSCHLQSILNKNIYIDHLIGLFTLFFFVLLVQNQNKHTYVNNVDDVDDLDDEYLYFRNILTTLFLYIVFICSLRLKDNYLVIFIILIGLNFGIRGYIDSLNHIKFSEKIKKLEYYSKILSILSIIILIIGMYKYYLEKKSKYGKNFNSIMFFIGNKTCKKYKI